MFYSDIDGHIDDSVRGSVSPEGSIAEGALQHYFGNQAPHTWLAITILFHE
jgi:hypothetical protein